MKKKILVSIVSIILALAFAVTIFAACVGGNGQQNIDELPSGNVEVADGEENGIKLMVMEIPKALYQEYGVAATAEAAYTVNATVRDEAGQSYEGIQEVTYSIAWASTKSDKVETYVKLQQNGTQATLTCLKAFDTKIVLTCTSNIDPEVKATKNIGYYKRFESVTVSVGAHGQAGNLKDGAVIALAMPAFSVSTSNSTFTSQDITFLKLLNLGVGTDDPAQKGLESVSIKASTAFQSAFAAECKTLGLSNTITNTVSLSSTPAPVFATSLSEIFNSSIGTSGPFSTNNLVRTAVYRALAKTTNQFEITLNYNWNGTSGTLKMYFNFANVVAPTVGNIQFAESGDLMF